MKIRSRRKYTEETSKQNKNAYDPLDPFHNFEGTPIELALHKAFYYIRHHIRNIIIIAFISFCLLFVFILYTSWYDTRESKSQIAFQELLEEPTLNVKAGSSEISIEKLDAYSKKYSFEKAKLRALLYKQRYLLKEKKYKELVTTLLEIGDKAKNPEIKALFYMKAGLYAENLKDYKRAALAYGNVIKATKLENNIKAQALLNKARTLFYLGNKKEAKIALEKLISFEKNNNEKYLLSATILLLEIEN